MTSTSGCGCGPPEHGQVKLVPSSRYKFSFTLEPKTETLGSAPLDAEVGETPGAARMRSNMLKRRIGIAGSVSGPNRVANPVRCGSTIVPASTDTDPATPPNFKMTDRSELPWTSLAMCSSWYAAKPGISTSSAYSPAASDTNRNWPRSLVTSEIGPEISAGELRRTDTAGKTPPDSSFTVPDRVPVNTWASESLAASKGASTLNTRNQRCVVIAHLLRKSESFRLIFSIGLLKTLSDPS